MPPTRPSIRSPRRSAGLSLVEMVLALAGTVLVGTTVAAMLHAVAYGSSSGTDLRNLVPKQRVLAGRINDAVRNAHAVLVAESDNVVLWVRDTNGDGAADNTEFLRLAFDPVTQELVATWAGTGATVVAVDGSSDFFSVETALGNDGALEREVWARDLGAFEFTPDAAPPLTRMIGYRVTVQSGSLSDTQVHAASLGGQP